MSWSVQGIGEKEALVREVGKQLDPQIEGSKGEGEEQYQSEYSGAKTALVALIGSLPDGTPYHLNASGSTGVYYLGGEKMVSAEASISLKSVTVLK